nr:hypothetical protein [Tanacetum cinerariifolium]
MFCKLLSVIMSDITDVRCVLTQEELDTFCNTFHIPEEVHPVLPNQDGTMYERSAKNIGLYTRLFDFANFRYRPLYFHPCSGSYQIAPDRADSEQESSVERLFDEGGSGTQTDQGDSTRGGLDADIQPVGGFPSSLKTEGGSWNPKWDFRCCVTNGSRLDDGRVFREMVDEFAPPKFFASVRRMKHDQLFTESNVGAARHMSLSDEVRMQAEYNVKERRRLKSVIEEKDELPNAREEEIGSLKARLLLKGAEFAEAICLRAEASNFEAVEKSLRDEVDALRERNVILEKEQDALDVKVTELATSAVSKERELMDLNTLFTSIKSQNDSLVDQVHELETSAFGLQEKVAVYENYMEQLEKFQDDRMKIVDDKWLHTHSMELAIAKFLHSFEYLSTLRTAISKAIEKGMQDGLAAGITHGKECRVFTDVASYNPSVKVDYISAMRQLQNVNFPLLAELRSNKDASVETIMEVLCLEEPVAKKLGLNELQPSVDQLMVPIHSSPDRVVIGATALSLTLDASSSRVWNIRENIANHISVLRDAFVLLAEPFSTAALTGMKGTSDGVPATAITTALSTTLALTSIVNPISIDDYEFVDTDDHAVADGDAASFPNVDDAELRIP